MSHEFGRIKLHRMTANWTEASLIWPAWFHVQGEDEILTLNFFIVWKHLPKLDSTKADPALWLHLAQNLDAIGQSWLFLKQNPFVEPQVKYFSINFVHVVLDQIWKSNVNITILRKYSHILCKAAESLEYLCPGGFLKFIHVREIVQV